MLSKDQFCCHQTDQYQIQVYGSAPYYHYLLLIEVNEPYAKDALLGSTLPEEVKTHLQKQADFLGDTKVLLIKNKQSRAGNIRCFFVDNTPRIPIVYAHTVTTYKALLFDWFSLTQNTTPHTEPLYLVCTNGKRDKCCAKFGLPIYENLASQVPPNQVWECSHFGGHRLAPTLITLPNNLCYGNLNLPDLPDLIKTTEKQQVWLPKLRGRCAYNTAQQAADYFLRQQLQITEFADLQLLPHKSDAVNKHLYQTTFLHLPTQQTFVVQQQIVKSDYAVYGSCNKPEKKHIELHHLLTIAKILQN